MIEDSDIGTPPDVTDANADGGPAGAGAATPDAAASGADLSGAVTRAASAREVGTTTITFKLYATLQDLLPAGAIKNAVTIEIAADASLNDVIDRHKVPRELAHLVLVNGVFVCDADRDARGALQPGDVLAIWPPVAGG